MPISVESIQFAVFTSAPSARSALELWKTATGQPVPENFQQLPPHGTQSSGVENGVNYVLQVQPQRVDLIASLDPRLVGSEAPPYLRDYAAALDSGMTRMKKILAQLKAARIAIVLQAFQLEASADDAVRSVRERVPGLPDAPKTQDLSYQITTVRDSSAHAGVTIARLCRWNTGRKSLIQFDMGSGSFSTNPGPIGFHTYIDVFSSEGDRLFPKKLPDLYDELAAEALSILDRGYDQLL